MLNQKLFVTGLAKPSLHCNGPDNFWMLSDKVPDMTGQIFTLTDRQSCSGAFFLFLKDGIPRASEDCWWAERRLLFSCLSWCNVGGSIFQIQYPLANVLLLLGSLKSLTAKSRATFSAKLNQHWCFVEMAKHKCLLQEHAIQIRVYDLFLSFFC